MKKSNLLILLFISFLALPACFKKKNLPTNYGFGNKAISFFESLPEDELLHINLKTDFKNLIKEKDNPSYQPAIIDYEDAFGEHQTWKVKVKPRGNMRRQICSFPPLKIKFPKSLLQERGMKAIKTMKIAVGCEDREVYQQYLLREYLAYKIYQIITEQSFKVKLAKVRIEDTSEKLKPFNTFAILIEHEKEMAERLGARLVKMKVFEKDKLSQEAFDKFCLFQYMIGNTDWHVKNSHNIKLLALEAEREVIPVAYDFDYAGFVNTPYAVPKEGLGISHVSARFYQGLCRNKEEFEPILQSFRDKKEEVLRLCKSMSHLDKGSQKYVDHFIHSFYKIIEHPRKTKRQILKHCGLDN